MLIISIILVAVAVDSENKNQNLDSIEPMKAIGAVFIVIGVLFAVPTIVPEHWWN